MRFCDVAFLAYGVCRQRDVIYRSRTSLYWHVCCKASFVAVLFKYVCDNVAVLRNVLPYLISYKTEVLVSKMTPSVKSVLRNSVMRLVFPFLNNPKYVDPSFKIGDCFGRGKKKTYLRSFWEGKNPIL